MPRMPRIYMENALYYVTSQKSSHAEGIFVDGQDYREYISLIAKYKNQYGFKLYSYVLLPTHLHLLIGLRNNIQISNIMHDISSLYTKTFNGRYGKKGHLFEARFRAIMAEEDAYLLPVVRYMHLSPLRAKLADTPEEYLYSSHRQYVNPDLRHHPEMTEEINTVFNKLNGTEEGFSAFVDDVDPKEMNEFGKILRKKRVLGSDEFIEQVNIVVEETLKQQKEASLPQKMPLRTKILYFALSGTVMLFFAVTIGVFQKKSTTFQDRYDKTMVLYDRTLRSLEIERDKAAKAESDIHDYEWKIKLTEEALKRVKDEKAKENERKAAALRGIEGFAWRVEFTQIGGPIEKQLPPDVIAIKDSYVSSSNLTREGFKRSKYSKSGLRNGRTAWETIQSNAKGDIANWRGEWDGTVMRGVLRMGDRAGVVRDFTFESTGKRMKLKR